MAKERNSGAPHIDSGDAVSSSEKERSMDRAVSNLKESKFPGEPKKQIDGK